jgi:hypothetical protein
LSGQLAGGTKTVVFWTNWAGTELGHATVVEASSADVNKDKAESILTECPTNTKRLGRLVFLQQELRLIFSRPAQYLLFDPSFLSDQPRDILHGLIDPEYFDFCLYAALSTYPRI